ncbi:MAG: response regulator [Arcobacteraceae bacterium]|nr:response regulator [Arcobacteraceae bacterium]
MINKEFLKNITVLYVEDDPHIRESMQGIFLKLFKHIVMANNGEEGYFEFVNSKEHNIEFDIVISDINMPKINGIEMAKMIRTVDEQIPIIFTTAHSDVEFLLDAIELNITHYAVKPVNLKRLMDAVQEATKKYYDSKIIKTQETQNERFINIINQVALVSKTNLSGTITYVNDIFCEVSGYTKEELLGENQRIVRHEDMTKSYFDTLWNSLRDGKVWRGKIKNRNKDGVDYIVNTTVLPVFDILGENILEYMSVGFVVTKEEVEKREFQKKVIQKINYQKTVQLTLEEQIQELEQKLTLSGDIDIVLYNLNMEKVKNEKSQKQLLYYEDLIAKKEEIEKQLKYKISNIENESYEYKKKLHKKLEDAKEQIIHDNKIIKAQYEEAKRLNGYLQENNIKIKNLYDVIVHREEQLAKLEAKLEQK